MKPVTLTVSEAHYDKALKAMKRGGSITTVCVMAQALKARFPKKARTVSCAWHTGSVGKTDYTFDEQGTKIATMFTYPEMRKKMRDLFPAKVTITPQLDPA